MENACNEAGEGEPGGRKKYQVIDSEVGGSPRTPLEVLSEPQASDGVGTVL